jgi:hypothetical protein
MITVYTGKLSRICAPSATQKWMAELMASPIALP